MKFYNTGLIRSVALGPNGKYLCSGSDDQTVRLWDANTGQVLKILHGHTQVVQSVALGPDGQLLASGSDDQTIKLWDAIAP